jgi:hypothetical protein
MSRFAYITEDPDYEDWADSQEQDILDWLNKEIDGVAEKPQEPYSPFETINS